MRYYLKEIKELENEFMELTEKIDILRDKKKDLYEQYLKSILKNDLSMFGYVRTKVLSDLWTQASLELDELHNRRYYIQEQIDLLRTEYIQLHTREFYRPMDEIDILNEIRKDGFIIAVKL